MENNCSESDESDFQASNLGTKEFWECSFKRDLHVYEERKEIDDIWFGQESVDRVLKWLNDNDFDKSSSIIDIGCGNGATLLALASEGFTYLFGIDYAASAIHLASTICKSHQHVIHLQECDFLQDFSNLTLESKMTKYKGVTSTIQSEREIKEEEINVDKDGNETKNRNKTTTSSTNTTTYTNTTTRNTNTNTSNNTTTNTTIHTDTTNCRTNTIKTTKIDILKSRFDLCLDKGTYDAICLNPDNRSVWKTTYQKNIANICKNGGLFIITSCNWTKDELMKQFCSDFELVQQIPTSTFKFGGAEGNAEAVLVLKKI